MKRFDHGLSRRRFLQSAGAASMLPAMTPGMALALESSVIKKVIPASGEKLSVIGLGTSRTFDTDIDDAMQSPLREVLQAFFTNAGQLIDSSPMYGSAEAVTGALLKTVEDTSGLFSATKVWTYGRERGIEQMQRSMRRLGVKQIDLMQIHNLRDWQIHLETLHEWKSSGKIRYLGITTSHGRSHADFEAIMRQHPLDFVQFSYNILDREAERRLLPLAQERGIATLINRPYQRGSLFRAVRGKSLPAWAAEIDCASWGHFFLKFIVSHPAATCVIPATSKLKHMIDNMGAGFGRLPDADMRRRMIAFMESL